MWTSALAICVMFRHNQAARLLVDAKAKLLNSMLIKGFFKSVLLRLLSGRLWGLSITA